jgi:hypothetical protein
VFATEDPNDVELMLNRFRRLMNELIRGATARNAFQPWELDILLDIDSCHVDRRRRMETLRQYQKAVERQLETGPGPPLKLSEYLERRGQKQGATAIQ